MEETFKDITPAEIQRAVLQFMGENIGELKTLDSHIVNKTNTLNGITLRPEEVLRSIPQPQQQHIPQPQQVVIQPQQVVMQPQQTAIQKVDDGQLEFDFNPKHYDEMMKVLNTHTRELREINSLIRELTEAITAHNKKKD
jgi:hypothetical protein